MKDTATAKLFAELKKQNPHKIDLNNVKSAVLNGADVNVKGPFGKTALMCAALQADTEAIRLLLEKGGDVFATDRYDRSALSFTDKEDIKQLLRAQRQKIRPQFPITDKVKATEVLLSEINLLYEEIDWSTIEMAIQAGANVNAKTEQNVTVLMKAVFKARPGTVKLILEHGADINAWDKFGTTALTLAVARGHVEIIQLLLKNGADINQYNDGKGTMPLFMAASAGRLEVAQLLLDSGADVNVRNNVGYTALTYAPSEAMKQLLRSYGAKE